MMKPLAATLALGIATALATPLLADGDADKGEKEFRKCKTCHSIASGDGVIVKGGKTGPNLYGVIGRTAGTSDGFKYGDDLVAAGAAGLIWTPALLADYITDPKAFLQRTLDDKTAKSRMTFKMAKHADDVAAYLNSAANGATSVAN